MPAPIAPQWVSTVEAFPEGFGTAVAVIGRGAARIGEAFQRAGSPPLAFEAEDLVVLADETIEYGIDTLDDISPDSLDLIVLRRAWSDRRELNGIARTAYRATRAGGRILAGDIDVDRLFCSSTIRYPSRLQYVGVPAAEARLRRLSTRMLLPVEVMRAGFRSVSALEIDEIRGDYTDVESYWTAVKEQGWPVFADLDPAAAEVLLEWAATELRRLAPIGPVVDDEPWFIVTGVKA